MEGRRAEADSAAYKPVRRKWCLGDRRFRKELLAEMAGAIGSEHYGEERRESEVEKPEGIVKSELRNASWDEESWARRRRGTR